MDLKMADIPIDGDQLQEAIQKRFACARCGYCCKGDGIVRFSSQELERMCAALGVERRHFLKNFAVALDSRQWILRDRFVASPGRGSVREQWCIFLERHPDGRYGCRLGDAKPRQCHAFPYDWVNSDSFQTCAGLRILLGELRREAAGEEPAVNSQTDCEKK
jgi:Fe-S-cluster containining protein